MVFINLISILGLLGFSLSFYLYQKKKAKKKLICPMRSNCDTVIHSDYSRIVGIPVEILGMIYYVIIGCAYPLSILTGLWSVQVSIILLGVSLCAALFSLYLVSIQAFVVRHWCFWCLCSAGISTTIAIISYLHFIWY